MTRGGLPIEVVEKRQLSRKSGYADRFRRSRAGRLRRSYSASFAFSSRFGTWATAPGPIIDQRDNAKASV